MNEKQLKQIYNEYAKESAPDMDKLWEKIDKSIEEKPENRITSTENPEIRRKRIANNKQLGVAAACIALIIAIPAIIGSMNNSISKSNMSADMNDISPSYEYEATVSTTAAAADGNDMSPAQTQITTSSYGESVLYENLNLADTVNFVNMLNAKPVGDDYFVEENVLAETEIFMDVIVDKVYLSDTGNEFVYELKRAGNEFDEDCPETLTIASATNFIMLENREYLLPLKTNKDGEYELVFDNAPQIEITLDGGMIFHNGWSTLDADGKSIDVIYPKGKADDFFYDRMKFSYTSDLPLLLEKWKEIRNK